MDEQKEEGHPTECKCVWCQGRNGFMHHKFSILRLFLGLIILLVVFIAGIKLGELKSTFNGGYGDERGYYGHHPMMRNYDDWGYGPFYGGCLTVNKTAASSTAQ